MFYHDDLQLHKVSWKWYNCVPLYGVTLYCVYMYHLLKIHSSFDGHLGFLHTLAVVSCATIDRCADILDLSPLGVYQGVAQLDSIVFLIREWEENQKEDIALCFDHFGHDDISHIFEQIYVRNFRNSDLYDCGKERKASFLFWSVGKHSW